MLAKKKILSVFPLVWLILVIRAVPALGDELSGLLDSALSKAKGGQHLEAFESLKEAELVLWRRMPKMATRRVVLVEEEPKFFGSYTPRPNNRYKGGESIIIYVEPIGYTIKESQGAFSFALTADFTVTDSAGLVLGGQRDFGRWERTSHRPGTEFMLFFTYDLTGLVPGKYVVETLIKDTNSEKSLQLSTPIIVEE